MSQNQKKLVYNEVKEISFFDELLEWTKDKSLYYWIIVICSWLSVGLYAADLCQSTISEETDTPG